MKKIAPIVTVLTGLGGLFFAFKTYQNSRKEVDKRVEALDNQPSLDEKIEAAAGDKDTQVTNQPNQEVKTDENATE